MKIVACILTCFLAGATQVAATSTPQSLIGIEAYDPLQHAHLIVRGTVLDVGMERILMSDWGMADKGMEESMMTVTRIRVAVTSVLRGELAEREVVFGTIGGLSPLFEVGHEYIVCAKWRRLKNGGVYLIGPYVGLYSRSGDVWTKIVPETLAEKSETLTDEQVHSRVQSADLANTTQSADVIARGRIRDTWRTQYTAINGHVGELVHYTLEVGELLKGEASSAQLEFVVARVSAYTPDWYRIVPFEIRVGEEWYVFLRRGERGLYPFGGPNSLLRVEGENLVYDNAVEYPFGVKEVNRLIRAEVSDGP